MTSESPTLTRGFGGALKVHSAQVAGWTWDKSLILFFWALLYQLHITFFAHPKFGMKMSYWHILLAFFALLVALLPYSLLSSFFARIIGPGPYGNTDAMKHAIEAMWEVFVQGILATVATFISFPLLASVWTPLLRGPELTRLDAYVLMLGSLAIGAMMFLLVGLYYRKDGIWIRGERILHPGQVLYRTWRLTRRDKNAFFWGGYWYPSSASVTGLLVVGAPRTGKTLLIRLLLQSIAPLVFIRKDYRMMCLDVKKEMFQILKGMGIDTSLERGHVRSLNPDDKRAWVWDLARDFRDSEAIWELAFLLIPHSKAEDTFWEKSARSILVGVLRAWALQGKWWELRDLVAVMKDITLIRAVLRSNPDTAFLVETIISEAKELGKQTGAMNATIWSYIAPFQDIATAWHNILKDLPPEKKGTRLLSITDWITNPNGYIILLGSGQRGSPKDMLIQMAVKRVGQLLRDHMKDSRTRRIWMVLDEIRIAGKLDIETLLAIGGGRGCSTVVGFQDKEGLDDEYREAIANEMLGLSQSKVMLGLATHVTGEYAAREIGRAEIERNGRRGDEFLVSVDQFTSKNRFPRPTDDKKVGITLVARSPFIGAYCKYISGRKLWRLLTPLGNEEGFISRIPFDPKRSYDEQILIEPFPDLTPEDMERLLKPRTPSEGEKQQLLLPSPDPENEKPREPEVKEKKSRREEQRRRAEEWFGRQEESRDRDGENRESA